MNQKLLSAGVPTRIVRLRAVWHSFIVSLAIWTGAAAQTAPATSSLLRRAEDTALKLPWLNAWDALFDRDSVGPDSEQVLELMRNLRGPWTIEQIRPLLKHSDPKVRALAILLLFDLDRVDVLPDIAAMVSDKAPAFATPARLSLGPPRGGQPWPMYPTAVGEYARLVTKVYVDTSHELEALNWSRSSVRLDDAPALTQRMRAFAAARDPELSTAGLAVAMQRATGAISPLQPERAARIQSVLSKLWRVPMPRRFYVALKLDFDRYRGEGYAPDFLLAMARQVPREMRLATIRGPGKGIDDPDLSQDFGGDYFLEHAVDLLLPSDAQWLLEAEQNQRRGTATPRSMRFSGYVLAAAMLRPQSADEILTAALKRFHADWEWDDRAKLATALAQLGSAKGVEAAMEWFFGEAPRPDVYGGGRAQFLEWLHDRDPIRYRQVVAQIVRDPRLSTLGPESTRILLTTVEGYTGKRLASDEEIRLSYGTNEAQRDSKFQHLAKWHQLLRETINEWDR